MTKDGAGCSGYCTQCRHNKWITIIKQEEEEEEEELLWRRCSLAYLVEFT